MDKRSQIRSFFSQILQIFAFPGNCSISEAQIFAADFRRKPQETADFRRKRFVPFSLSLVILT